MTNTKNNHQSHTPHVNTEITKCNPQTYTAPSPPYSVAVGRNDCRDIHDITSDNYSELTAIASSVGINWQAVSEQISSYPFKITRGIELERAYKGKVTCFGSIYKSKGGKEYPRITFYTNKHGGITEFWSGYNAEHDNVIPFTPRPIKHNKPKHQEDWHKKRFNTAKELFSTLPSESGEHPYLIKKFQDQAPIVAKLADIRTGKDRYGLFIMIELMRSGFVAGYQKIYDRNIKGKNRNKDYIFNADGKNGAYLLINGDSDKIYIAEGLATGLTIALATGSTVAVALDAGNIIHVAESLADQNIIIAADNDTGKDGNTGILKSIETAKKFRCRVVAPNTEYKADYNDVFIESGIDSVNEHLTNKIKVEKTRFDYELQRIKYLPENQKLKAAKRAAAVGIVGVPFKHSIENVIFQINKVYKNIKPVAGLAHFLLDRRRNAINQYMSFDDSQFIHITPNVDVTLDAGGVFLLNWGMGSGKTNFMRDVSNVAEKNNLMTMYLTHRVAIVDNAAARLEADHYQDVQAINMRYVQTLVSCINSLSKAHIIAYANNADVLMGDEIRQILEAIAVGTIPKNQKAMLFDKLRELIANTKTVLVADADIDQKTIDFLKSCGRELYFVDPPKSYVPVQKTVCYGDYKQVETYAIQAIREGERCLIFTDSKEHSATLAEECRKSGATYLLVNGDTRGDKEQKAFLAKPNIDRGIQVVIATPVISSGFSIESDLFDQVFILSNGVLAINEIVQTAARYRPSKGVIIGFSDWHDDYVNDTEERERLSKSGNLTMFSHWNLRCKADIQNSRTYGASGVLMAFESKGWVLHRLGEDIEDNINTDESKKTAQKKLFKDVRNAEDIDKKIAATLNKSYSKTYAEVCDLEKYNFKKNMVQDEITKDDFLFWNRGKALSKIDNADISCRTIEDCRALDSYEIEQGIDISLRTNAAIKHRVFNQLSKSITGQIGNLFLNSSNLCALEITVKNSVNFLEWCTKNSDISALAGITVKNINRAYAIRSLSLILNRLGIKVDCSKSNGKRTYIINDESLGQITEILERRQGHIGIFSHIECHLKVAA